MDHNPGDRIGGKKKSPGITQYSCTEVTIILRYLFPDPPRDHQMLLQEIIEWSFTFELARIKYQGKNLELLRRQQNYALII